MTEQTKVVPKEPIAWVYPNETTYEGLHRLYGKPGDPLTRRIPAGGIPVYATPAPVQGSGGEGWSQCTRCLRRSDACECEFKTDAEAGQCTRFVRPPSRGSEGVEGAGDEALADTQRAIIKAAEWRGYARGLADAEGAGEQAGEVEQAIKTCLNVHGDREIAALLTRQASALAQARARADSYWGLATQANNALAQARAECERLRADLARGREEYELAQNAADKWSAECEAAEARAATAVGVLRETREGLTRLRDEMRHGVQLSDHAQCENIAVSYVRDWVARIDTLLAESGGEGG